MIRYDTNEENCAAIVYFEPKQQEDFDSVCFRSAIRSFMRFSVANFITLI